MLNWVIHSPLRTQYSDQKLQEVVSSYQTTLSSNDVGFFKLSEQTELLEQTKRVYEKFKHKKYFIHVGIGGSALGPEMILKARGHQNGVTFSFLNNIDPDELARSLKKINLKECLIYVVSKSGTTAETVAVMSILIHELNQLGVTPAQYPEYFVFCTDPQKGDLRALSQEWKIDCLNIPSNVGGRFSVLTPVGLLPAFFAGLKPDQILAGAYDLQKNLFDLENGKAFFELGLWLKELHDQGVNQTVMMPYSSLLKDFSAWFVQLWAESLGKEGKGLTPIAAYGATDQHSQMQLFMEGPSNKVLFLIEVEKFQQDYSLHNSIPAPSFKTLSPYSLSQLMKAEFEGTLSALKENKRPLVHIKLADLSEASLGQLILFSECLTVLVGNLLKVDPFNQPGVEAGKKYAYEWLKNRGI